MEESAVALRLTGVSKSFGSVVAVKDVSLALRQGTLTSLLGPSGCGKTTLLRLIAGIEIASGGEIEIKGRAVGGMPIHQRNIGLVFQNYALFPHKTVYDNIAFGLKHRGVDAATTKLKVKQALDIVRLPGIEARYPNQLSGGQQQRVALARAVVFEPDVLLLDEPLSALDANLREEMRVEIKLIQKALRLTTILVTHDQEEALAMSDEIVVMNLGSVRQTGDPKTVYRFPRDRFVAGFLGQANVFGCEIVEELAGLPGQWVVRLSNGMLLKAKVMASESSGLPGERRPQAVGAKVDLMIRGSDMIVSNVSSVSSVFLASDAGDANAFKGKVIDSSYLGDTAHYLIDAGGVKFKAVCRVARGDADRASEMISEGAEVYVRVPVEACAILRGMFREDA